MSGAVEGVERPCDFYLGDCIRCGKRADRDNQLEPCKPRHHAYGRQPIPVVATPPVRSYADGVADVVNLCRQWSEPGAKVLSSMSGLTNAEHAIAQRTAEGIAEAAAGLLSPNVDREVTKPYGPADSERGPHSAD